MIQCNPQLELQWVRVLLMTKKEFPFLLLECWIAWLLAHVFMVMTSVCACVHDKIYSVSQSKIISMMIFFISGFYLSSFLSLLVPCEEEDAGWPLTDANENDKCGHYFFMEEKGKKGERMFMRFFFETWRFLKIGRGDILTGDQDLSATGSYDLTLSFFLKLPDTLQYNTYWQIRKNIFPRVTQYYCVIWYLFCVLIVHVLNPSQCHV